MSISEEAKLEDVRGISFLLSIRMPKQGLNSTLCSVRLDITNCHNAPRSERGENKVNGGVCTQGHFPNRVFGRCLMSTNSALFLPYPGNPLSGRPDKRF